MKSGFTENCVRCNHLILEFDKHPDCSCGCHSDTQAALNAFLADGGTREKFMEQFTKVVDKHKALDRVLGSGLFG